MAVEPIAASGTTYRQSLGDASVGSTTVSRPGDVRLWQSAGGSRSTTRTHDPVSEESDRRMRLTSKLLRLATLQGNWDTYGAEPPSEGSLKKALETIFNMQGPMLPEDVLPSVEGGVTLVYASDARGHAEIEFDNDGEIIAAFKRRGEPPRVWSVEVGSTTTAVSEFHRLLGHGA